VKLVFLGKLADLADGDTRDLSADRPLGWAELLAHLKPELAQALDEDRVRLAQNGQVVPDKRALVAGPADEIAFLPPVSGG
jgi:molybdopterin synthase sulfur carrier subunit